MRSIINSIENRTVYPILIKNNGIKYLTLYYCTERSDSVLHKNEKCILYFLSMDDMERFCKTNDLLIKNDVVEFDFDAPIKNPLDHNRLLNNWNLLNTISEVLGMFFEGDARKYNSLYELLFRLCTPSYPTDELYRADEKELKSILKVFRKKDRFFNRFELYQDV